MRKELELFYISYFPDRTLFHCPRKLPGTTTLAPNMVLDQKMDEKQGGGYHVTMALE